MKEARLEKTKCYRGAEAPIECFSQDWKKNENFQHIPHYHDYIEFLFGASEGRICVWVGGETVTVGEGDLLIIHSEVPHALRCERDMSNLICLKALPGSIYSVEHSYFDMRYLLPFWHNPLYTYQYFSQAELAGSSVPSLLAALCTEWQEKLYGYEIACKSHLLSLYLWLVRYNHAHDRYGVPPTSEISENTIAAIRRSLDYIREHYAEADEYRAAEAANLSYSYYSRMFRHVVGKNFSEYVTMVRLRHAERLLLSTDMTVTEIAYATGFSASSHFIESFRKNKKITPKQYRIVWRRS